VSGAAAEVVLEVGGKATVIGHAGLFAGELQKKYDLRQAAAGLEVDLGALLAIFEPVRRAMPVPRFPGIDRDLSMVVAEATRWADVLAALQEAKLAAVDPEEGIEFVTTFRSGQVGAGKKSLTLALHFRDPARTLTSEEVDAQVKVAVDVLVKKFQATLRA
jgi:phenylalanyl-tRNA synthetase beta chain